MKWKKLTNCTETDTNHDHDHFPIGDDQIADIAEEATADTDPTAEAKANTDEITEVTKHTDPDHDHIVEIHDIVDIIVAEVVVNTNHQLIK